MLLVDTTTINPKVTIKNKISFVKKSEKTFTWQNPLQPRIVNLMTKQRPMGF